MPGAGAGSMLLPASGRGSIYRPVSGAMRHNAGPGALSALVEGAGLQSIGSAVVFTKFIAVYSRICLPPQPRNLVLSS